MEDEFIPEEEKLRTEVGTRLISDRETLFSTYDATSHRIKVTMGDSYEMVVPLRTELFGKDNASGLCGDLIKRLDTSRLKQIDIGQNMITTITKIKELSLWSERYKKFLEEYLKSMDIIVKSAFKIMNNTQDELERVTLELEGIKERTTVRVAENVPRPKLKQPFDEKFKQQLVKNLVDYINATKEGDEKKIASTKYQVFLLGKDNKEKMEHVRKKFLDISYEDEEVIDKFISEMG